jgi:hypothetical protein
VSKIWPRAAALALFIALASAVNAQPLKVENLAIATARGVYHFKVEIADSGSPWPRTAVC